MKSSSTMTKMDAKSSHRRSCANSSALPIQLVWKWPDVPCSGLRKPGVGSAAAGNRPKTARRAAQDRPPRRRWRRRSLCAHPAKAPFNPTPTAQRRSRGRAALSEGLIATSHAFSAPYKGSTGSAAGAHHHLAPPDDCAAAAARAPDLFSCTPGGSIFKQGEKSRDGR